MNLNIKQKKFRILILSILIFVLVATFINVIYQLNDNTIIHQERNSLVQLQKTDGFNILDFWEDELERVNNTDLRLDLGDMSPLEYKDPSTGKKYHFTVQEIEFESPNWENAHPYTITIHGYILYPEDVKAINPGALVMHGLNGDANQSFEVAYNFLLKDCIVLTFSFPGHGESEGPTLAHENFYYEDDFDESSHFYLDICSAIQGLRVLERLSIVNNSKIMVAGGSFGGLNTMWLSGVCGERIAGTIVLGAIGDLKTAKQDPTKLIFWVFGKNSEEIPDSFWEEQALRIDPKYYLESENLPPILFSIGTNDEFFLYRQINGTFDSVPHDNKFLQIYPNEHHALTTYHDTTKFFIDYILSNDDAPPDINLKTHKKELGILGESLNINVEIKSDKDLESVQVCYKYIDIVGSCWAKLNLEKNDEDTWTGLINPGIINSKLDYYIIVNLEGKKDVWFSSKIYTTGQLTSNSTIPIYILFAAFIVLPAIFLILRRYKKEINELEPEIKKKARNFLVLEISLICIIEFFFYFSLFLPWIILESGPLYWSHFYIFNNIYTWQKHLGIIGCYFTTVFFVVSIVNSQVSIKKPILAGLFKTWYPILVLGIFLLFLGSLNSNSSANIFGTGYPGFGFYLHILCAAAMVILGIWKRKYQVKLGIKQMMIKKRKKE